MDLPPAISPMHGLELTYHVLAETPNLAAIPTLAAGLSGRDPNTRRMALAALTHRRDVEAGRILLANWSLLKPDDFRMLSGQVDAITEAAGECFAQRQNVEAAIDACGKLKLVKLIDPLCRLAETASDQTVRTAAGRAILEMAAVQGEAARRDRASSIERNPMIARLVDSLQRFASHRNITLIDALLTASTWSDAAIRSWAGSSVREGKLIRNRLASSKVPGVIELLAGFVRRRQCPEEIIQILLHREDEILAPHLLAAVSNTPSGTTRRNLATMGLPKCLSGGLETLSNAIADHRAAVVHVYASANRSTVDVLWVATEALRMRGNEILSTVAQTMSRVNVPDQTYLMKAAVQVAKFMEKNDGCEGRSLEDCGSESLDSSDARLVARLMDLLSHEDVGIAKAARRLLGPLHAEQMLGQFDGLRLKSRRRLGQIVMRIDETAVAQVRDGLRHPVLERRLEAIASADALGMVASLGDSFQHIVREDHQEARIRAAEAMGDADDERTLSLLEEMLALPESLVRDAASAALQRRVDANA